MWARACWWRRCAASFRQGGFRVAPFKAQNMSNNSYVTPEGGEIGRAQAVQAEAAGIEPSVEMNPILLKPETDNRSQVVLLGKPQQSAGREYFTGMKPRLWEAVTQSLDSLREQYDIVVIEGAGSPAEINLKRTEIVNMRVALYAEAPVLLVGDIDRGGVFASLVGTLELLDPEERERVKAFVINKFRGDLSLLTPGLTWLEQRTDVPVLGVIPYYRDIHIAEEDAVSLEERQRMKQQPDYLLDIAVIGLPHISNFDDFDPLKREDGVRLRFVEDNDVLGLPDLVILPGTKTTVADLDWLRRQGLGRRIQELVHGGTPVIGICGGYQMMGAHILDPEGVESQQPEMEGLGLLPVATLFSSAKNTHRITGEAMGGTGLLAGTQGLPIQGYEIHMGSSYPEMTTSPGTVALGKRPFHIHQRSGEPWDRPDGAIDAAGQLLGTYIHGLFYNHDLRKAILRHLAQLRGVILLEEDSQTLGITSWEGEYEKLARLVRSSLNMDRLHELAGLGVPEI